MLTKFRAVQQSQIKEEDHMASAFVTETPKNEETKTEFLRDIVASIHEDNFSDLCPDDIPDDEVSDVDESEFDLEELQKNHKTITQNAQIKA
jgi:hypothetical protein